MREENFVAGFRELSELFEQAKSESDPRGAVLRSAAIYFDFLIANRHRYALMFGMNSSVAPPSERARKAARESLEQWASVVSLLSGLKEAGPEEVRLARQIWASTHGCIAIGEHSPIGPVEEVRHMALESVAYLVDGFSIARSSEAKIRTRSCRYALGYFDYWNRRSGCRSKHQLCKHGSARCAGGHNAPKPNRPAIGQSIIICLGQKVKLTVPFALIQLMSAPVAPCKEPPIRHPAPRSTEPPASKTTAVPLFMAERT